MEKLKRKTKLDADEDLCECFYCGKIVPASKLDRDYCCEQCHNERKEFYEITRGPFG